MQCCLMIEKTTAWWCTASCSTYTKPINKHWKSRADLFFHGCKRYVRQNAQPAFATCSGLYNSFAMHVTHAVVFQPSGRIHEAIEL